MVGKKLFSVVLMSSILTSNLHMSQAKKAKNGDKVSYIKKTKKKEKKENGTLLTKLYTPKMYTTER